MALNPIMSMDAAKAALDCITDLINQGGAGVLRIYSGTKPASPEVAVTDQVLLASMALSNPSFGAAEANGTNARATAESITADPSADNSGTASWFRIFNGDGDAVVDGTVGTSNTDLTVKSAEFVGGATIAVTSLTLSLPTGAS